MVLRHSATMHGDMTGHKTARSRASRILTEATRRNKVRNPDAVKALTVMEGSGMHRDSYRCLKKPVANSGDV